MRKFISRLAAALLIMTAVPAWAQDASGPANDEETWSIVIHGGAGTIERSKITPEKDAEIRAALDDALSAGAKILDGGGSALDAVTAVITRLENNPDFNAGKGAVFTWEETNEMDASIMDGRNRDAGAVAGVTATKNPILLARKVMTDSPHVMLSGKGADIFSREQGLEQVDPSYFATERRLRQIKALKAKKVSAANVDYKFGTVGAAAMDRKGNMAAGTSTGGMTGKRWGRIGDSPIIGAGTYADNRSCAVSATGWGEYFIRLGIAQEICARIRLRFLEMLVEARADTPKDKDGMPEYYIHASEYPFPQSEAQKIADDVIAELDGFKATGGIILTTPWGHTIYSFNTAGMYRGNASSEGAKSVAIYGDEE